MTELYFDRINSLYRVAEFH